MNKFPVHFILLVSSLALMSCSSGVHERMEKNRDAFNALPEQEKVYASKGQVVQGMSPGAVQIAWGKPDTISTGMLNGKESERWLYRTGGGSGWSFGVGGGLGHSHHNTGYGLGSGVSFPISHVPANYSYVLFIDGKVDSWLGKGNN